MKVNAMTMMAVDFFTLHSLSRIPLELVTSFRSRLVEDPDGPSDAVAAIKTLLDLIRNSKGES